MTHRWRDGILKKQQSTGKKGRVRPEDIVPILNKFFYSVFPQAKVFSSHPMIQDESKWAKSLSRFLNEDNKDRFEAASGRLGIQILNAMGFRGFPTYGKAKKEHVPLYKSAERIERSLFELQTKADLAADRQSKR